MFTDWLHAAIVFFLIKIFLLDRKNTLVFASAQRELAIKNGTRMQRSKILNPINHERHTATL